MKKILFISIAVNLLVLCLGGFLFFEKGGFSRFSESTAMNYVEGRVLTFNTLDENSDSVVFLGDSLTEGGEWSEIFNRANLINRGINGDSTEGVLNRIEETVDGKPEKLFIMVGINDLEHDVSISKIVANYNDILKKAVEVSPDTEIYVQSVLPNNSHIRPTSVPTKEISALNSELEELAGNHGAIYVDVFGAMVDNEGNLSPEYTYDGVHLIQAGYTAWVNQIESAVME